MELIIGTDNSDSPQVYYAFTNGQDFQGVMSRDGKWKLHGPRLQNQHGWR